MKLAKLFKPETPIAEYRQKLRDAIEAGKISEDTDAATALLSNVDSLDVVELEIVFEERGEESDLSGRTVRELLWQLDRLNREYEVERERELSK